MIRIISLRKPGTTADTAFNQAVDTLLSNGFTYVEDLWEAIGPKFTTGLTALAVRTGVSEGLLIHLLADGASEPHPSLLNDGRLQRLRRWVGQNPKVVAAKRACSNLKLLFQTWWFNAALSRLWPELSALLIASILIGLLGVNALRKRVTVLVAAESGLPAFHFITDSDLKVEPAIHIPGSFTAKEQVVNRYLLQRVPVGSRLYANQLSKVTLKAEDMADRQVLVVPIKASMVSTKLTPPDRVSLIFIPHDSEESDSKPTGTDTEKNEKKGAYRVDDVIVLAVDRQGESTSLVIALKSNMEKLVPLLGNSNLVILQPFSK